jgi:hypothetical protein
LPASFQYDRFSALARITGTGLLPIRIDCG